MLKIRLQRTGRRNNPFFRVVVTDKQNAAKSGRFIEVLGAYDPKAGEVTFKAERVKHWLSVGAQPSHTVHNFLVDQKLIEGKKINVLPQKTPVQKEEAPVKEKKPENTEAATEAPVAEEEE